MSTKQQTLSWLADLPEESEAWRELHEDARLLRDIAAAEEDVRSGRERPQDETKTAVSNQNPNSETKPPAHPGLS